MNNMYIFIHIDSTDEQIYSPENIEINVKKTRKPPVNLKLSPP